MQKLFFRRVSLSVVDSLEKVRFNVVLVVGYLCTKNRRNIFTVGRKQMHLCLNTAYILKYTAIPVTIVGMFFHMQLAETRLFFVERLLFNVRHRLPFGTCSRQT